MQFARRPERRRTTRVTFQMPLIVQFHAPDGDLIQKKGFTHTLSGHGALMVLDAPVKAGQTLHIFNDATSESVQCYVTSVRERREHRYVGLGFSCPDANFWHIVFPKALTRPAMRSARTGALIPAGWERHGSFPDTK